MSDLDKVLAEVWDETAVEVPPTTFNAAVFERIARQRARMELGFAALLAVAAWAIAMGLGPSLTLVLTEVGVLMGTIPVLTALGLVGAGLGLVALLRFRFRIRVDRDWVTLGFGS